VLPSLVVLVTKSMMACFDVPSFHEGSGSVITLASDLGIITGNDDALSFIGSDLLQIYISELAWDNDTN
jgi:hypothetical protein